MTRVLVAAPSAVARAGLAALVGAGDDVAVVGSAAPGAELAQRVAELHPDVVLLELEPGEVVPDTVAPLDDDAARSPALVVLADELDAASLAETFRSGGRALLPRTATAEELVAAVHGAAAGLVVLHPDAAGALAPARAAGRAPSAAPTQHLTPRENEVLAMLAEGLGNKQIAARLGISEHTVKAHLAAIFAKLEATSRTEAVMTGARLGLVMV